MLEKSIKFATEKHSGQFRKISGKPYVTHPIEVSLLVSKFKTSKKIQESQAAAVLHDTLEDTNTSFQELAVEFSPLVASLVLELTSDAAMIQKITKKEYLKKKMLGMSSYGLVIKLCDRLSNIQDHPTDKARLDTREIIDYLKVNRKLSKTHKQIIKQIEKHL